jgi:hypothetical protein
MTTPEALGNTADKRAQHLLRDFEIEDRAAADWSMDFDTAWFATEESSGLVAHRNHLPVVTIDCDDGRLIHEQASARVVNERVDCTQVYSESASKKLLYELHGERLLLQKWQGPRKRINGLRTASRMPRQTSE